MIIDHGRRFAFIHVQKTAGLSATSHLLSQAEGATEELSLTGGRHARMKQLLDAYPQASGYFIFGFVRNPWARMYSWHSMIMRRLRTAESPGKEQYASIVEGNLFWSGVKRECPDFEAFVLRGPEIFDRLRRPQIDYLRHGGRLADFIGRTESFDSDFRDVCRHVGIAQPLAVPRRNTGSGADYREHYTAQMRDQVARIFAEDVKRWRYEF